MKKMKSFSWALLTLDPVPIALRFIAALENPIWITCVAEAIGVGSGQV